MTISRNRLIMAAVFVMIITVFHILYTPQAYAAAKRIKTYQTGIDVQGTGFTGYTIRYRVTSYYLGRSVKYSKKREVGEIRNTGKKTATRSLSLSKTTSRSYSISASTIIPKRVLQNDVSMTIGGSLSFSNTISISVSADVPPHKSRSVYLQYKYCKDKYRYVVQKQIKKMYGKWKNIGKVSVKYNTSTTKVPVLTV